MLIPDFIARCDAFCEAHGQSRVWLSKRLFNDTFKIENLDAGATDIGVRRLAKAEVDLAALEKGAATHGAFSGKARNMAPAIVDGAENPERNVSRTDKPGSSSERAAS
ncbi:hypothetical protein [Brevundimonas pondensis]|uniref:Uncharacterized protein n=1 Tax=Brevundimonas pondensis TaxID=2774189 RepID=A0ABX7SKF8_9CAUL|nr:hypothetical protein [Brevundimonas pondensis]QTC88166.1 hypothetical protein IFE19_01805 [Brevundimonas pondensis]